MDTEITSIDTPIGLISLGAMCCAFSSDNCLFRYSRWRSIHGRGCNKYMYSNMIFMKRFFLWGGGGGGGGGG